MKTSKAAALIFMTFILQGCITKPTLIKPNTYDLAVSRQIVFDQETPDKRPVTAGSIANEIAKIYPSQSQYNEYRTSPTYTGTNSCIGNCAGEIKRATGAEGNGVRSRIETGNSITIEYVRHISNSSGRGQTITQAKILVSEDSENPGAFNISAIDLTEKVGTSPGLFLIGIDPVAPIEKIAEDIALTIQKINPSLNYTFNHQEEFSANYPVASVLSNYERHLGKPLETPANTLRSATETQTRFSLSSGSVANISVSPYRNNESFVKINLDVPYQLNAGGGNTFSAEKIQELSNRLRQIAFD